MGYDGTLWPRCRSEDLTEKCCHTLWLRSLGDEEMMKAGKAVKRMVDFFGGEIPLYPPKQALIDGILMNKGYFSEFSDVFNSIQYLIYGIFQLV